MWCQLEYTMTPKQWNAAHSWTWNVHLGHLLIWHHLLIARSVYVDFVWTAGQSSSWCCLAVHQSLQSIWSTCSHTSLLAILASSSHSIPHCHELLFAAYTEPALSPGPRPGPVHCWTFSSLSYGEDDIPPPGAHLEPDDADLSLRADVHRPAAYWPFLFFSFISFSLVFKMKRNSFRKE